MYRFQYFLISFPVNHRVTSMQRSSALKRFNNELEVTVLIKLGDVEMAQQITVEVDTKTENTEEEPCLTSLQ